MARRQRRTLTEAETKQLETMSGLRVPMEHMAAIFGMSKDTLERVVKKSDAVRAALEKGRAMAGTNARQTAYQQAMGTPAEYDSKGNLVKAATGPNTTMLIFWLKTQEGFKETAVHEHTGKDGAPLGRLTPEQRREELRQMREFLDLTEDD